MGIIIIPNLQMILSSENKNFAWGQPVCWGRGGGGAVTGTQVVWLPKVVITCDALSMMSFGTL